MSNAVLTCRDDRRRALIQSANAGGSGGPLWNGIEYVETRGDARNLEVHFLCGVPARLKEKIKEEDPTAADHVRIESSTRTAAVEILRVGLSRDEFGTEFLGIELASRADNSTYTVFVLDLDVIDPRHAAFEFTFATDRPTEIDPKPRDPCPPPRPKDPEINYLARDYASLRQLIRDRLSLTMPAWSERHIPDIGVMLIELLAYAGDQLSYYQDAVATEAYLGTARQRISVRRHARLVDYRLHEGCSARTFVHIATTSDLTLDPRDLFFITKPASERVPDEPVLQESQLDEIPASTYQVFEPTRQPAKPAEIEKSDVTDLAGLVIQLLFAHCSYSSPFQLLILLLRAKLKPWFDKYCARDLEHLPATACEQFLRLLNRCLQDYPLWEYIEANCLRQETQDLLEGLDPDECRPQRNRAVLDDVFSQEVGCSTEEAQLGLFAAHSEIAFYTWGDRECCLPLCATSATLRDRWLDEEPDDTDEDDCDRTLTPMEASARRMRWRTRPRRLGHLAKGDLLLLEEVLGPRTGVAADADPTHRHVVRLTSVEAKVDPLCGSPVLEIEWEPDDALPFPLCISSVGPAPRCELLTDVSVARGNIVLVDHGRTIDDEPLGRIDVNQTPPCCDEPCSTQVRDRPSRFRPALEEVGLTYTRPVAQPHLPATTLLDQELCEAKPEICLRGIPIDPGTGRTLLEASDLKRPERCAARTSALSESATSVLHNLVSPRLSRRLHELNRGPQSDGDRAAYQERRQQVSARLCGELQQRTQWTARHDLLDSRHDDRHFVVEMDNERRAHLRFGDDMLGQQPAPGTQFWATYRVGHGVSGNVGADKITRLVFRRGLRTGIVSVRNPLAAVGGRNPESLEHAKLHAPHAFRRLERAITAEDYATLVARDFNDRVQGARATMHWTGSWHVIAVTIDPTASVRDVDALLLEVEQRLYRYRRMGHEVRVRPPRYVSLDIAMTVCVSAGYLRAHVQRELLNVFSDRVLPDGRTGFFHPDNLSFGEAIYLSQLIYTAKEVSGVENVTVTRLRRMGHGDQGELAAGVMEFGALEIPRLKNDPDRQDCGQLCLDMRGER